MRNTHGMAEDCRVMRWGIAASHFISIVRSLMNPLHVLRENGRLVAFGFFMCFCSSVGHTFFISLFNGELRHVFNLSHGDIGAMYAAGTIASAAIFMFAGRLVDRVRLPIMVAIVFGGLALSALGMGLVASAAVLPFVFFGLRLFGQGLASHTGMTAMARSFNATRGRAISLASLGFSAGEALLPTLTVALLAIFAWQSIWLGVAAITVLAVPLGLYLLKGERPRKDEADETTGPQASIRHWRLGAVLRHATFWLRLPTFIAPAFIATGLFFHQVHLAEEKGWPLPLIAGSFTAFALSSIVTTLFAGPLVDRLSARQLWPWVLLPMALSCVVLASSASVWVAPAFMILIGMTTGLYSISGTAMWPELYGTRHLGAIKAFVQSVMVLASGVAPVALGVLIDRDVSMNLISLACAAWCVFAAILAVVAMRRDQSTAGSGTASSPSK